MICLTRSRRYRIILCLTFIGSWTDLAMAEPPMSDYVLTWNDEFDGNALDPAKWRHRCLGPRNDAINVKDAVTVADGCLTITVYTAEGKHYSGMVSTHDRFQQKFGYFEARIRFQGAGGVWSGFWMKSPTFGNPLGNPAVAGSEIDIVEHRKFGKLNKTDLSNAAQFTIHWDGDDPKHLKSRPKVVDNLGVADGFHIYGVDWDENGYRFYVDGRLVHTCQEGISHCEQPILLSSEVRDRSWAGLIPEGGYGSPKTSRVKMTVDYVRAYRKPH